MNPYRQAPLASVSPSDRRHLWWLLLITVVIHVPSLFGPFFIDDYVYVAAARILNWSSLIDVFTSSTMDESASSVWWVPVGALPFYRPIGELSLAFDYFIWHMLPVGYHITNLLLHLLCTCFVWRLARYWFKTTYPVLIVAAVFAIHPVHTEAIVWISGRFDALVCATTLGSMLSYLQWRLGSPPRWRWYILALLLFVTGLGCKETAVALPAMVFAVEIFNLTHLDVKKQFKRTFIAITGFTLVALGYLAARFALFGGLGELPPPYGIDRSSPLIALQSITGNLMHYLLDFMLCIPVDAFFVAEFWRQHSLMMALAIFISLLLVVLIIIRVGRIHAFRLGMIWIALFTAPALMAMPGERNVYLASVGLAMMFGVLLVHVLNKKGSSTNRKKWSSRFVVTLFTFWGLVCVLQQGVMWSLAAAGEKIYADIEAYLPAPVHETRIYVVNQSPLNSVGFEQALRLRYNRGDLHAVVLTVAPTLDQTCRDSIEQTAADRIKITREGGFFFDSFVDRFHLFDAPASSLAQSSQRVGLELLSPPDTLEGLNTLEFRLAYPIEDSRIQILEWDNSSIRSPLDYANMARTTKLVPWPTPAVE